MGGCIIKPEIKTVNYNNALLHNTYGHWAGCWSCVSIDVSGIPGWCTTA